jgi:outer membrane autotransporter protein
VDGALAPSVVAVDRGATLGGVGTVGGIIANGGGAVAPGDNSIAALHVAAPGGGDVAFRPNSLFRVELNAAGQSDQILASGKATITGGVVQVAADPGVYKPSTIYTLLTANGGVFGVGGAQAPSHQIVQSSQFFSGLALTSSAPSNFASLQPMLAYDADDVYIEFPTAAPPGEIHASAVSAAFEDSRLPREAILDRLSQGAAAPCPLDASDCACDPVQSERRPDPAASKPYLPTKPRLPTKKPHPPKPRSCEPRQFEAWGQAFGDWGRIKGAGDAVSISHSTGGFIAGLDAKLTDGPAGDWRVGVAGGFTDDTIAARLSSGAFQSVFAALYGGAGLGAVQLRAGAVYGLDTTNTNRQVVYPTFAEALRSSYGGAIGQIFGEAGYRIAFANALDASPESTLVGFSHGWVEPFVGVAAVDIRQDGFAESGGATALTGFGRTYDFETTTLGLRSELASAAAPLTLRTMVGWRRAYGALAPIVLESFAGSAGPVAVSGVAIDRDALAAEVGLQYRIAADVSFGLSYSGQFGRRSLDNAVKARLDVNF